MGFLGFHERIYRLWGKHTVGNCSCILHLSIFGNWTVRNHLIEKCLRIISASKEDIMRQSMKRKVLLLLQVNLLQLTDFKPPSWPYSGLNFEVVTCATSAFLRLFGFTQQNMSVLYSKPIACLSPKKVQYFWYTTAFLTRSLQSLFSAV